MGSRELASEALDMLHAMRGFALSEEAEELGAAAVSQEPPAGPELTLEEFPPSLVRLIHDHDGQEGSEQVFEELEDLEVRLLLHLHSSGVLIEGRTEPTEEDADAISSPQSVRVPHDALATWLQQTSDTSDEPLENSGASIQIALERARQLQVGRKTRAVALLDALDEGGVGRMQRDRPPAFVQLVGRYQRLRGSLVERNFRLVLWVAAQHRWGLTQSERVMAGARGLVRAVDGFDVSRGFRLATYATWWIRQSISRAKQDYVRAIRVPVHEQERSYKARIALESAGIEGRERLSAAQLAALLGVSDPEARRIQAMGRRVMRADVRGHTSVHAPLDHIFDDDRLPPAETNLHGLAPGRLATVERELSVAIASLNVNAKAGNRGIDVDIIEARLGLGVPGKSTLEELGTRYGLSRERIRQRESNSLPRVQKALLLWRKYGETPHE